MWYSPASPKAREMPLKGIFTDHDGLLVNVEQ